MNTCVLLGAHMSTNGGVYTAHERGMRIGCTTIQLFTKNNTQWTSKPLSEEDVDRYKALARKSKIRPVVAHSSYLINLCAKNRLTLKKSREAFRDELWRCEKLGIPYLVFHPGAHVGQGEEEGIKLVAESLNVLHDETPRYHVKSVLEVTAGQGTALGYRFEQLRKIIDLVESRQHLRVASTPVTFSPPAMISNPSMGMRERSGSSIQLSV